MQKSSLRLSVIVASHRPEYIDYLMKGLERCAFVSANLFEIIVVADYQVENFSAFYPFAKWVFLPDFNISAKRNKGVAVADAEIIAFIDDDCVPAENWIKNGLDFFDSNPYVAGVEGKTIIKIDKNKNGPLREYKRLETPGLRTNNIFYKKSIFLLAGGFDERFSYQREDVDLAFTIMEMGYSIAYCDKCIVEHCMRSNPRWDLLKNCWNRRFDPLLFKKHSMFYRKYIGSPFPPSIFLLGIGYCVGAGCFFVSSRTLVISLTLVLFFALVLSVRRNWFNLRMNILLFTDFISYIISPIVMLAALIYGSCRFRKFLLI